MFIPTTGPKTPQEQDYLPQVYVDVTRLPSKGLAYPPGARIRHRPYTFGEVKMVSQAKPGNDRDAFEFVLAGIDTSFDKQELTISDVLYLGLLRKLSTFGNGRARVESKCHCGARMATSIETSGLEFADIQAPELPAIVVMTSGRELEFTPITVADHAMLSEKGKLDDEIAWYAAQVRGVPFDEAFKCIYEASAQDEEAFREVDAMLYHGLSPVKMRCNQCGSTSEVELDGEGALILPFRGDEGTPGARVRYGARATHLTR